MDPEEQEAMILVDAIRRNEENIDELMTQMQRLAKIVDHVVSEQKAMKRDLATLRMYQANGWKI